MSNIIVYLAVDKDGEENIFDDKPIRHEDFWYYKSLFAGHQNCIQIPSGTIKKLTGKDMTWESGYVEYVGDNYDQTIH